MSWAVRVASVLELPETVEIVGAGAPIAADTARPIFDPVTSEHIDSSVVERDGLASGATIAGPAVIIEAQTTTVLGSHHQAVVQPDGSLRVTRIGSQGLRGPNVPSGSEKKGVSS